MAKTDAELIAEFMAKGGKVTKIVPAPLKEVKREPKSTRTQMKDDKGNYISHRSGISFGFGSGAGFQSSF